MSSQYRAPLFLQIATNQLDRINIAFSNASPLAYNGVLTLSDTLKGYNDDRYSGEFESATTKYNLKIEELKTQKGNSEINQTEYEEKLSEEKINYAHTIYGLLCQLMKRKGMLPADNADDMDAIDDTIELT